MFIKQNNIFTWQNEIQKHLFGEASSLYSYLPSTK